MSLSNISACRIFNQQICFPQNTSPKELVAYMGAMQAQDYLMAKWAIGLRIQNTTDSSIIAAYNKGEIIRTHLMRPTWHFVSADDVYWMLELTAPQIKTLSKSRNKQLELNDKIFNKSNDLLINALEGGENLTKDELSLLYTNENIRTNDNRLYHLLMQAELDGIICSGETKGNKLPYSLLQERVPIKKLLSREESLAELAKRYFTSHSPATLRDFIWWSGLSVADARKALEMIKPDFDCETLNRDTYWFNTNTNGSFTESKSNQIYLLPAFDELLIGYRNRTATITDIDNQKAISNNGIFRPILVINGKVCGIWKRETKKAKVGIEISLFEKTNNNIRAEIEQEAMKQALFMEKNVEVTFKSYQSAQS